ncbi:hypothetical protein [uncultured Enterococcus sp.]|uniref:hypothetical protein n=1 Tax=uncultured Enterococcus sp. TaxID=167972 RepID=UPI002AA869EA|nr:hypothetical protein [uncultured Enterococcus sp.]
MNSNELLKEIVQEQKETNRLLRNISKNSEPINIEMNCGGELIGQSQGGLLEESVREAAEMFLLCCLVACRGMTVIETREHVIERFKREQINTAVQNVVKELFEMEVQYATFNPPCLYALTGKGKPR